MDHKEAKYEDGQLIIYREPCNYCWNNGNCHTCKYWIPDSMDVGRGKCREVWPQGAYYWPRKDKGD